MKAYQVEKSDMSFLNIQLLVQEVKIFHTKIDQNQLSDVL